MVTLISKKKVNRGFINSMSSRKGTGEGAGKVKPVRRHRDFGNTREDDGTPRKEPARAAGLTRGEREEQEKGTMEKRGWKTFKRNSLVSVR